METADGIVRRKLDFNERSFAFKLFYVDIRSVSVRNKAVKYIHELGGNVETFLSKEIHVFVTDTKYNKRPDRIRELNHSIRDGSLYCDNPSPGGSCLPLSRGKALLLKARGNGSEHSSGIDRGLSNNVMIQKATDLGLKIEHVNTFLKKCKTLCGSDKIYKSKSDTLRDIVPLKWDNDVLIVKIEDDSNLYKPLHKQFDKLPAVYVDNGGGSPFDGPVVLEKSESVKKTKSTKFYNAKGGYCEMCDVWFKASLRNHLISEKHNLFVNEESNFTGVESIVNKLPNLSTFLSKFCVPKPMFRDNKSGNLRSRVVGISDKNNCDDFHNKINETTIVENNYCNPITENIKEEEMPMEDNYTNFTSSDTIIYDYLEQFKGGNSILHDVDDRTTGDFMGLSNDSNMFSENSVHDSQTDVLKNMISNWTLQDDGSDVKNKTYNNNLQGMSCSTPVLPNDPLEHNLRARVVPGLPKPVWLTLTNSDSEPDVGMSFSTPKIEEKSLLCDIMSLLKQREVMSNNQIDCLKNNNNEREKTKKRKRDKVEKDCVYFSKKTDDTKLKIKLCKMTPAHQKTNLKMFWKVRKTGECRLVFSAGKCKKPLQETNDLNTDTHEVSPLRKRQRTLEL